VFRKISVLPTEKCLNAIKPSLIDILKSFTVPNDQIERIPTQWKNIKLAQRPKNLTINEFYKDGTNENPFDD
jgi:hypothetical protein